VILLRPPTVPRRAPIPPLNPAGPFLMRQITVDLPDRRGPRGSEFLAVHGPQAGPSV